MFFIRMKNHSFLYSVNRSSIDDKLFLLNIDLKNNPWINRTKERVCRQCLQI
ncbi:hypothetical protein DJ66_0211 [Candidatus Liberibacter solanacearum]|uniref:Uncharacterized protein n=1 Tax=Candidatus Liberibacter solanacearum TaxID=556287 RepID=A0A0F4VPJ7_9HYPH|nr:hypothetical protein DJ66_0211 [Candidatus Liberibacter solanacearum]